MPRISQLPSLTTADNADEIAIVDVSASTTKKITRGDLLKAPLPNNSVTTAAIADGAVTAAKIADGAVTSAKLADTFVRRQNNTTNTTVAAPRIETGWGWIQVGGSAVSQVNETVTFQTAFTTLPIVLITYGGDAGNTAPSYGTGGGVALGAAASKASNITTTNFVATITADRTWPASQTIYYQWIAIGA